MGELLLEETVSLQDCFNRHIASRLGAVIEVLERVNYDGNKTVSLLGMKMTTAMTIETFRVETRNPTRWKDTTIDAPTEESYEPASTSGPTITSDSPTIGTSPANPQSYPP